MAPFIQAYHRLALLSAEASADLLPCLAVKTFEKGSLLLRERQICNKLFFVESGLVKVFFATEEKEFIMRFFPEHSLVTILDSFTLQQPSAYEIMALEDTTVSWLNHADLERLCKKHHCIETGFRKLLSVAAVNMMKRVSELLEENAGKRYDNFLRENGALLQRISLGDLANYLGITQVSLSRIRSRK